MCHVCSDSDLTGGEEAKSKGKGKGKKGKAEGKGKHKRGKKRKAQLAQGKIKSLGFEKSLHLKYLK